MVDAGGRDRPASQLLQKCDEGIDRQGGGVAGDFRQSTYVVQQVFPSDLTSRDHRLASCQLGDGRTARHRRNAALGAKADVGDAIPFQSHREFEDVAADWILQARGGIGRVDCAGVARVLEMVKEFGGVHIAIVMGASRSFG